MKSLVAFKRMLELPTRSIGKMPRGKHLIENCFCENANSFEKRKSEWKMLWEEFNA